MTTSDFSLAGVTHRRTVVQALGAAALAATGIARAQETWPSRTVRLIVTTAAGGAGDTWARAYADALSRVSGQPVVVENKAGAGGLIGTSFVAQSQPDGYTMLVGFSSVVSNEVLRGKLPYKPSDLAPVAGVMMSPQTILIDAHVPVRNLAELRTYARSQPKGIFYAAAGTGATSHMVGEQLRAALDIPLTFVHFKSGAECMTSVLAGQTQLVSEVPSAAAAGHIKAGHLRALALTGNRQLDLFPGVQTTAQQGFGDIQMASWFGLFARAGAPAAVTDRVAQLTQDAVSTPAMRTFIANQNAVPMQVATASFAAFVANERERMTRIARAQNIKLD